MAKKVKKEKPDRKERADKADKTPPVKTAPVKTVPAGKPGKLYVNAEPWATIYVDGAKLGPTPIVGESLEPGDHTLKAVTEDGRVKTLKIQVESGGNVRKKVTW